MTLRGGLKGEDIDLLVAVSALPQIEIATGGDRNAGRSGEFAGYHTPEW